MGCPSSYENFTEVDAKAILVVQIPQIIARERVSWTRSMDVKYSVKTGYRLWHESNHVVLNVTQTAGGSSVWRLPLPHKVKILVWHFCRNNLPIPKDFNYRLYVLCVVMTLSTCYTCFLIAHLLINACSMWD